MPICTLHHLTNHHCDLAISSIIIEVQAAPVCHPADSSEVDEINQDVQSAMPKRLKKAIGRLAGKKNRSCAGASPSSDGDDRASFLHLPAEVRNQIYYELAAQTSLVLRPTKSKKPVPQSAFLLACRQTRQEFKQLLLANAQILVYISDYHFCNVIRVFETLSVEDLDILKLNPNIWILIQIAHVPSRDDYRNLRGWIDYRGSDTIPSYFGPNKTIARQMLFEYDVRFSTMLRPPRPWSRYASGYEMKVDLLRTHLRMHQRLLRDTHDDEKPNEELQRLKSNMEECVRLFEELQTQRSTDRSMSVCTTGSVHTATTLAD